MSFDCTTNKYADLYARWLENPNKLLKLGGLQVGDRVIDLCGGTGIVAQAALDWGASYVVVADLNPRVRLSDSRLQPIVARAESIDVAMRFVEYRLYGDSRTDGFDLDKPFDFVVCRQAIGYVDIQKTAFAVANVLRPGGRFVFNTFKRPKWSWASYAINERNFYEASGFIGRTVFHIQMSPQVGIDITKFRWHTEDELDAAFMPLFEIDKTSSKTGLYYVCTRRS